MVNKKKCIKIKECPEGKVLNPKTNRCIKIKELKKVQIKECPEGKVLNPKTNRCIKIKELKKVQTNSIYKPIIDYNKKAYIIQRKFKKFIYPFINRVSANIYNRKKYYNLLKSKLNLDNKKNNYCMRFYKYDTDGKPIFRVGDKIILKKKIGTEGEEGIVYLSSLRDKENKLFKFAVKIAVYSSIEYKILSLLSSNVLDDICPHFPITYDILLCKDFLHYNQSSYLTSNTNSQNSLKKIKELDLKIFPKFIEKNINEIFIIYLNELANGDLKMFIHEYYTNSLLLENALGQIYFSLIFFYKQTGMFHNDAHWGNFLYHKIKAGGYFHYKIFGKDYYIENIGYLWIINDFGRCFKFGEDIKLKKDFYYLIQGFVSKNEKSTSNIHQGWFSNNFKDEFRNKIIEIYKYLFLNSEVKDIFYSPTNLNKYIRYILYIFKKNKIIKTTKEITKTDKIINIKPYSITPFN